MLMVHLQLWKSTSSNDFRNLIELIIIEHLSSGKSNLVSTDIFLYSFRLFDF